jgi:Tfp pilus assembly protein PilX
MKKSALSKKRHEKGFVLVTALLALVVVTIIAVLALSTSTTQVMVAGNERLREINLAAADAGVSLSEPVMRNPDRIKYTFLTSAQEQNLRNEIYCKSQMNSDDENFLINLGESTISIDIDFINAAEPGAGYALDEGGPPIVMKDYVINSRSTAGLGSENVVGALYYLVGYCEH